MMAFLTKLVEIVRRLYVSLFQAGRRTVTLMQSVQIDQARGVILCVIFQVVVVVALIVAS